MKIICAASVLLGREAFGTLGEVLVVPDRQISRDTVRDVDALIVRSKTEVTRELLEGSRVSFVGTATAGFDHIATDYLAKADVAWYAAAGCNANSVAEYVTAALLHVARRHSFKLNGLTLGIIGNGQVGSRVAHKAQLLGMRVLLNDPPLALKTGDPIYHPLEEILPHCDVVTLHTPLERKGSFPTEHLVNCRFFEQLKPGAIFINAARGEVMDTASVLLALEKKVIRHAILDVWENEPVIARELLATADLGTPHIAGYSFEGRLNGTVQCYHELCRFAETAPRWTPPRDITHPALPLITADATGLNLEEALSHIIFAAYEITADDHALRSGTMLDGTAWGQYFDALRKNYPVRREFAAHTVRVRNAPPMLLDTLRGFDFQLDPAQDENRSRQHTTSG
ncbi:MAG: 4-phosphoerythronate dehydrogenase [Verrucomicrobia bacterium]|nr:MAG: 4-phosphoerythronate dehydrogenase [Verrucomicrobiota bacterium]